MSPTREARAGLLLGPMGSHRLQPWAVASGGGGTRQAGDLRQACLVRTVSFPGRVAGSAPAARTAPLLQARQPSRRWRRTRWTTNSAIDWRLPRPPDLAPALLQIRRMAQMLPCQGRLARAVRSAQAGRRDRPTDVARLHDGGTLLWRFWSGTHNALLEAGRLPHRRSTASVGQCSWQASG